MKSLSLPPMTFIVDEHHVNTYKSKGSDGTIISTERPADVFRNSIATPSLVAEFLLPNNINNLGVDQIPYDDVNSTIRLISK